jgi:hypothetical protein
MGNSKLINDVWTRLNRFLILGEDYTEKQLEHIYGKWLYEYGGAQDVKTFREYVNEYKGDPDKYGNCPCYTCQTGDY